jgi:hypothetical protein
MALAISLLNLPQHSVPGRDQGKMTSYQMTTVVEILADQGILLGQAADLKRVLDLHAPLESTVHGFTVSIVIPYVPSPTGRQSPVSSMLILLFRLRFS